ncbi:MAG TPA: PaaX family transcriptional regulator C-terminal domain-containing protein [Candidatus Tumulicola sp.]
MSAAVNPTGRRTTRPTSLIFSLYGDLVHASGPSSEPALWLGTLVELMSAFDLSEAAVRQAVSRMARQGWLRAARDGKRAYYTVTTRGRRRIEELSPRIYGPVIEWDGKWRLLAATIDGRDARVRLRQELRVLGWAPLTPAVWISPADSLRSAVEAAERYDAAREAHLFVGVYEGPLSDRELVERCWDLPRVGEAYEHFIATYRPLLERELLTGASRDRAAFAERLWLVHDFRKFAYLDPGLPSELVPAHWPGTIAAGIFREYYALLAHKAQRFLTETVERA